MIVFGAGPKIVETVKEPAVGQMQRTYTVQNAGLVQNCIYYNQRTDAKTGKILSGDVTARSTGIGINYGWYSGGTLRIIVNKIPVMTPAAVSINGDTLLFQWEEKGVDVQLSLAFTETSSIIGEVSVISQEPVQSLEVGFIATPGHVLSDNRHTFDRWASTTKRNLHLTTTEKVPLDPVSEFWVMMYDAKNNAQRGIPALLFDPEKMQSADVTANANKYIVRVALTPKSLLENVRFMLWSVPERYMDAEALYDYLKETATENLDTLRNYESPKVKSE